MSLKNLNLKWLSHSVKKNLLIFIIGFCVYPTIEIIWNTIFTPYKYKIFVGLFSMGVLGGILLVILGNLNEIKFIRNKLKLWVQAVLGGLIITLFEFITGLIVNVWLNWHVWDYSHLPFNIMGQVCLLFTIFWIVLSPVAFWIDDIFRVSYDKLRGKFLIEEYYVGMRSIKTGSVDDLRHRYKDFLKR